MNNLCIFVLACVFLGVNCLPSRQRRQFDWAEWENNANDGTDWSGTRTVRQRGWDRGNSDQGVGRQFPQNNGNVWDPNFGDWNQGQQNWNQGFPNTNDNTINQGQSGNQGSTTEVSTTTRATPAFMRCLSGCQSTFEYNPVCGTDSNTYHNLQRLQCASRCGASVQLSRGGTCQPL